MTRPLPVLDGRERPANLAVLLREAFVAVNDRVTVRLADRGHAAVRTAHGAVFQYIDDTGTTVSALAERAGMTKQAMAELVAYLERHDYVTRTTDPDDRRAKLVSLTGRGREVLAIAQGMVPELDRMVTDLLGERRTRQLRQDLEAIRSSGDVQAVRPPRS